MSSERVLIGSRSFGKTFPEHLERLRAAGCEVIPNQLGRAYREAELFDALDGVSCIVTGTDELTRAVIDRAGSLRVIAKHGVGVENIDVDAAQERGIVVLATPGAMSESVAELAFALMLTLARSIVPAHLETRAGGWRLLPGHELRGKTLGLLGFDQLEETARLPWALQVNREPDADRVVGRLEGLLARPLGYILEGRGYRAVERPAVASH